MELPTKPSEPWRSIDVGATARNRALLARYPEVFASRFPGSSAGWVDALTRGATPPPEPGLVWASAAGTRIYPWRRARIAA